MVAEPVALRLPAPLPLLVEPDPPSPKRHGWVYGWTRGERNHDHDRVGALVQHAIVRYVVHGVSRSELARETGYSERQVQAWITGRAIEPYSQPVRRALRALGIKIGRGGRAEGYSTRYRQVIAALVAVLEDAQDHLWTTPAARETQALARLLLAGRESLDGRAG